MTPLKVSVYCFNTLYLMTFYHSYMTYDLSISRMKSLLPNKEYFLRPRSLRTHQYDYKRTPLTMEKKERPHEYSCQVDQASQVEACSNDIPHDQL